MNEHVTEPETAFFLEGRLSPWQRRRVERHLALCLACAAEVGETFGWLRTEGLLPPQSLYHLARRLERADAPLVVVIGPARPGAVGPVLGPWVADLARAVGATEGARWRWQPVLESGLALGRR